MSATSATSPARLYGPNLGVRLGAEDAPCIVSRSLEDAELAVTEIRVDRPLGRLSDPIPRDDGFMICYMIRELPENKYWEEGRQVSAYSLRAGDTTVHDLKRGPAHLMDKPVHSLLWYISRATLNKLADQASAPYVDELRYKPGVGVVDETIQQLSVSLMPAFHTPERISRLFADYITLAFAAHAAEAYGGMRPERLVRGGLAPWQERRSKEMIAGDLSGATPLAEVAAACGLSVGHFSRAFRKTTGVAPHAWLLKVRIERAMSLLRQPDKSLTEIALTCGFADQSHFTRVFSGHVGEGPGAWRRLCTR